MNRHGYLSLLCIDIAKRTTIVRALCAGDAQSISECTRSIIERDMAAYPHIDPSCEVHDVVSALSESYPYKMGGRIAPNNAFNTIVQNLTAGFVIAHMREFSRLGSILIRIIATSHHLSRRMELSRIVEDYCLESIPTSDTTQWMTAQILHNVPRERFLLLFTRSPEIVWAVQQAAPAEFIARVCGNANAGDDLPAQTPLSLACQHGHAQTVEILLGAQIPRHGILIDHLAFKAAIDNRHWRIARRLLEAGARIRREKSIAHRIISASLASSSYDCDQKSAGALLAYLFAHGIRAQSRSLLIAAKSSNISLMRDLLDHGADPNEPSNGQFAFTEACKLEFYIEDVWRLFTEHGANPHLTSLVSPKSAYEKTIEFLAEHSRYSYNGVRAIVRRFDPAPAFLLGLKETLQEPSEESGDSPVTLLRGFPNIVEFILSCGSRRAVEVELF